MNTETTKGRPQVAVTLPIFPDQLERLRAVAEVTDNQVGEALTREALAARLVQAEGALISLMQKVDGELVAQAPRLRALSNVGVGVDHVDIAACTRHGVALTSTPGAVSAPTADCAFALMLAAARRVVESDAYVRAGHWTSPVVPIMGQDIHNRTLGIVGFGRIGRQIARRATGFDMRILYTNRNPVSAEDEAAVGARRVELDELLAQSDFVVLQVPYGPETHHLIGARELAVMKKSAILVNSARGGIVDDVALAAALKAGTIAGAALDVVENEPRVNAALLDAPNLTLMPHLGTATLASRHAMVVRAIDNLIDSLAGRESPDLVNRGVVVKAAGSHAD